MEPAEPVVESDLIRRACSTKERTQLELQINEHFLEKEMRREALHLINYITQVAYLRGKIDILEEQKFAK
jgi:hypothetical protein